MVDHPSGRPIRPGPHDWVEAAALVVMVCAMIGLALMYITGLD